MSVVFGPEQSINWLSEGQSPSFWAQDHDILDRRKHGRDSLISKADFRQTFQYEPLADARQYTRLIDLYDSLERMQYGKKGLFSETDDKFPHVSDGSVLKCALKTVLMDAMGQYHAISYLWGDHKQELPIILDSRVMSVPRNLRFALEDILNEMKQGTIEWLPLWADAISIDQANVQEKNDQIQLMCSIYSNAARVIAVPGYEDSTTRSAAGWQHPFKLVRELRERVEAFEQESSPDVGQSSVALRRENLALSAPQKRFLEKGVTLSSVGFKAQCASLAHFVMKIEWWKRAWVRQEMSLCASDKALVFYEGESTKWSTLVSVTNWLNKVEEIFGYDFFLRVLPRTATQPYETIRPALERIKHFEHSAMTTESKEARSLAAILYSSYIHRPLGGGSVRYPIPIASLAVDQVYALLALAMGENETSVKADYMLDSLDVFRDLTVNILSRYGGWAFQCMGTLKLGMDQTDTWPSWVIQWGLLQHRRPFQVRKTLAVDPKNRSVYNACGLYSVRPVPNLRFELRGNSLKLQGLNIGTTEGVTELRPVYEREDRLEWLRRYDSAMDTMRLRHGIGPDWKWTEYKSLLPIADQEVSPHALDRSRRARASMKDTYHQLLSGYVSMDDAEGARYLRSINRSFEYDKSHIFACRPYAGIGVGIRDRDEIFIINGGPMPVALRPSENGHYRLIGEVYVQGVMDGELVNTNTEWDPVIVD